MNNYLLTVFVALLVVFLLNQEDIDGDDDGPGGGILQPAYSANNS
jgi:hypothetical protein